MTAPEVTFAGDAGVLVRLGGAIDEPTFQAVQAAVAAIEARPPPALVDVVPAYASVLVIFDPARADPQEVAAAVRAALAAEQASRAREGERLIEIPVLYASAVAPDLEALAAEKGLTPQELAARHAAPLYRCHMLGFRPGFPFLGGLDPALAAARLGTPRVSVPAGAIGIGGEQTGIYPSPGPGGWRLIGRTPLRMFDPSREDPFLIHPGDRVRFVPIDPAAFETLAAKEAP